MEKEQNTQTTVDTNLGQPSLDLGGELNMNRTKSVNGLTSNGLTSNYLDVIKDLKESTIDKEEYNRVLEENRKLLNAYVNGSNKEEHVKEKVKVDINKLRSELYGEGAELSNLQYAQKTLQLREALIEQGESDPFLPIGQKIAPTDEDVTCANKVAEALQDCIEYADGDSAIFTNELQRIMVDVPMPRRRSY